MSAIWLLKCAIYSSPLLKCSFNALASVTGIAKDALLRYTS